MIGISLFFKDFAVILIYTLISVPSLKANRIPSLSPLYFSFVCGAFNRASRPICLAARSRDAFLCQRLCDCEWGLPLLEHPVNPPDNRRLFFVYDEVPILAPVIAKEPFERYRDLAVCKPLPLSPCDVLQNGAALFLRQRGHNGQEQLALAVKCPDIFLLEHHFQSFIGFSIV